MNYIISVLLLHFIALELSAQKIVEKHVNLSSNGSVNLNIQIADSITIRTWNKKEAYVRASVNVNDNKNNDDYKWDFDETGGSLGVKAKFDFPKGRSNNCDCNNKTEINCVIYIPENTNLAVETINGNITISGQTAEIKAKSISGFVDMSVSPKRAAEVKLNTITGTMYSDFDFSDKDKNMKRVAGTAINSNLNGGGANSINLETISGDIYFHKS
ncbi:MAG: DUF4097 family beta strand repeat-containing protein [Segetibacter sp.]